MAVSKIDLNRGVVIRTNPTLNMDVFMYLDDPGVYLNAYEKPVPQTIAKAAGYDIERWGKLRMKKQAMLRFQAEIDANDLIDSEATSRKVLVSRAGYSLIELPLGRAMIEGPDGEVMGEANSKELVSKLFDEMFPPEFEESAYETEVREGVEAHVAEKAKAPAAIVQPVKVKNVPKG